MSDDLVKRLRTDPNWMREDYPQSEAADRIEAQADRIAELEAALREIECSHIPDQPAAFDCTDLDWARRHVGKLRLIARAALGEKE